MSQPRTSMAPPPNSNLYCASCDSQIGIFENEWVHLTTSYARSQEKGTHFGTEIGVKTQLVPEGSAQKNAEGCEMSEVYCIKCSTVVAQYCRTAPEPSQKAFIGQYFYKLSRVYLKDSHTSATIQMYFKDDEAEQSQKSRNSVASSTAPRQKLQSTRAASDAPFRQSFPPPSNQTWQRPQSQTYLSQPVPLHDFRSASAQPMLDFRGEQLAPLAECANRITATDMRLANQEMRFNTSQEQFHSFEKRLEKCVDRVNTFETDLKSVDTRVENLNGDHKHLESFVNDQDDNLERHQEKVVVMEQDISRLESQFYDQDNDIKEQHRKFEEQNKELRKVTAKLDEMQGVVDDLKATINEVRSRCLSSSHTSLQPSPQELLENLQVMVNTMRDTQVDSAEIQDLRNENTAMKNRLRSIAGAMGFAPDSEISPQAEENVVLGKRKRGTEHYNAQQRKASRTSSNVRQGLMQSMQSLPTPDSTQNNDLSLHDVQGKDKSDYENEISESDIDPDLSMPLEHLDDHVIYHSDEEMMEQTDPKEAVVSSIEIRSETERSMAEDHETSSHAYNEAKLTSPNTSKLPPAQAVGPSTTASRHSTQFVRNHDDRLLTEQASRPRTSLPATKTMFHPATSRNGPLSFTSNRPVSMIERMRSPSVRNSPAPSSRPVPGSLPPFQISNVKYADTLPQERPSKSKLQRVETFSGALSRGETLENIVQRSQTLNIRGVESMPQEKDGATHQEAHQDKLSNSECQILQPSQASKLNTYNVAAPEADRIDVFEAMSPEETAEFSDVENELPAKQNGELCQNAAKTPVGEPKRGPTLISRTVPGLTFEPLVRPVIVDENDDGAHTESRRPSVSVPQIPNAIPIMPEIMAAIKNLNGCVVLQPAPTASSTPASRSRRAKASAKDSNTARKTETASKNPTEQSTKSDQASSSVTRTRSRSSAKDVASNSNTSAMVVADLNAITAARPSKDDNAHAVETVSIVAGNTVFEIEQVSITKDLQEQPKGQSLEKPSSMRKSLSRQQLLMERNRLAMEAMEREDAGTRFNRVAV